MRECLRKVRGMTRNREEESILITFVFVYFPFFSTRSILRSEKNEQQVLKTFRTPFFQSNLKPVETLHLWFLQWNKKLPLPPTLISLVSQLMKTEFHMLQVILYRYYSQHTSLPQVHIQNLIKKFQYYLILYRQSSQQIRLKLIVRTAIIEIPFLIQYNLISLHIDRLLKEVRNPLLFLVLLNVRNALLHTNTISHPPLLDCPARSI